jgi:hypothetical protein
MWTLTLNSSDLYSMDMALHFARLVRLIVVVVRSTPLLPLQFYRMCLLSTLGFLTTMLFAGQCRRRRPFRQRQQLVF